MPESPDFAAYHAAMTAHAEHPVRVEMSVMQLTMLLSALQLALRHPHFPASIRQWVEPWVEEAITNLGRLDPALETTLRAGNDPTQDVPWEEF